MGFLIFFEIITAGKNFFLNANKSSVEINHPLPPCASSNENFRAKIFTWNYQFAYFSQILWRFSVQIFRSSVFKAVEQSLHEVWSNSSIADCRSFQCFKWSWIALVVKTIPFGMSAFNSSSIVIICANEAPFPPEMDSEHAFGSFKDKTLAKDDFDSCANSITFGGFSVKSFCWSLKWRLIWWICYNNFRGWNW